ncbi:hypothetical protein AB0B04_18795 [Streptomyces xinghaiensis]|uniref:Uncharacterized protein n=2 Tax=Streptomyces TaxID=1883 RepID=A0A420UY23_9ACTN|nr:MULTISPECIES: hypothetical protein [Streptomyces]KNE81399.1 hypothetical protein ADZ36_16600 [Streptomyces fradiae]OFA48261.1 hypothetical protein BEN35_19165 [Streptomyces fradiae]PQM20670.1 hypothetical protein Sfr7A_26150 [Streptomyces xinghaiensis]RKM92610.1 hypothetical protein SFRA_024805 [Streptomyces xinghaiensis]RNC70578.1 hypothetical protein DC095_025795 [Streptomyces xinghaiensis]
MTIDDLRTTTLASLTIAGFTDATATRQSDTIVIATVPAAHSAQADITLTSHTALRLADRAGRARYALFPAPDDGEPYHRTVYFRATGPGLAPQHVGQELCHIVRIIPGHTTEADIPKALATALFADPGRAGDITVTRLA